MQATDSCNYYEVLGVERSAAAGLIRTSYRRLMQHEGHHPDLGGDAATAALINKAYAVLSNPALRNEYDLRLDVLDRVTMGLELNQPQPDPVSADRCLFCEQPQAFPTGDLEIGCEACGSPMQPARDLRMESNDQRAVRRIGKKLELRFFTHWPQRRGYSARSENISPGGLRMVTARDICCGQRIRLVSKAFEAVGEITHCAPLHGSWRRKTVAGVSFLTLRFVRAAGSFVSRQA